MIADIVKQGLHEWIDRLQENIGRINEEVESAFFFYDTDQAKALT